MKVLIIAQNLFIARLLISLAERHNSITSYKVIVFSTLEKIILERVHGVLGDRITYPSQISEEISPVIHSKSIEEIRGTYSKKTIERLQSILLSMLELNGDFDYQNIWIFNQNTFIGTCLKLSNDYASKSVVFENSNKNGGVTILGDLYLKHGYRLRGELLDKKHFTDQAQLCYLKLYRLLTMPLHIRSLQGVRYYLKRFFTRFLNIVIFYIIRRINNSPLENNEPTPIALLALQIRDDAAVAMEIDFSDYCGLLVNKAMEVRAKKPGIQFWVRPHPLDYTFGWLSVFLKIKRLSNVRLDLSNINSLSKKNVDFLITYNSNILRHEFFEGNYVKVIHLGTRQPLPSYSEDIPQIQERIF